MTAQIAIPQAEIAALCQRYYVQRLALFGSVLRDDFDPSSDLDMVVEFEADTRVGFFKLIDLQDALSDLLERPVDLHTPESLSKYFRQQVVDSAQVIYERT